MSRLSYRSCLTISSAILFVAALVAYRPGFGADRTTGALLGSLAGFWLLYIVGTVVLAIGFAVLMILRGDSPARVGLKDERDRVTERRAYAVGFWVLFLGTFASVFAASSGGTHLLATVMIFQVTAIGGILLVGLWDELSLMRLAGKAG